MSVDFSNTKKINDDVEVNTLKLQYGSISNEDFQTIIGRANFLFAMTHSFGKLADEKFSCVHNSVHNSIKYNFRSDRILRGKAERFVLLEYVIGFAKAGLDLIDQKIIKRGMKLILINIESTYESAQQELVDFFNDPGVVTKVSTIFSKDLILEEARKICLIANEYGHQGDLNQVYYGYSIALYLFHILREQASNIQARNRLQNYIDLLKNLLYAIEIHQQSKAMVS